MAVIDEVVLGEISSQRQRGLAPSIVLMPRHIGVQRQLRDVLERIFNFGSPVGSAVRPIGPIAGVDVYESQRVASNKIAIADLAQAIQLTEPIEFPLTLRRRAGYGRRG
jgi:hypothetical protein